jgi:hypothetical protein
MHPTLYPSNNSLLKMKNLRVMTGPFDLLGLGGYSAAMLVWEGSTTLMSYLMYLCEATEDSTL